LFAADREPANEDSVAVRIKEMTQLERERLRNNFKVYRQMSESKRRRYRNLHRELVQAADRDQLETVLENYYAWLLNDISRAQSENLRLARDTAAKLALVRELKSTEKKSPENTSQREQLHTVMRVLTTWQTDGLAKWMFRTHRHLKRDDYLAILGIVENSLPLTSAESAELKPMTGARRHLRVIKLALREGPPHSEDRTFRWPSEELAQQLVDVISSPRRKVWLRRELSVRRNPMNVIKMLLPGLVAEWLHEVKDSVPSDEELDNVEKSLDDKQRERLNQRDPKHRRCALRMLYLIQQDPGFAADLEELFADFSRRSRQMSRQGDWRPHRLDRHRRKRPPHDLRGDRRDPRNMREDRNPPVPSDDASFDGRGQPRDREPQSSRSRE
jgi:hypothetical protein